MSRREGRDFDSKRHRSRFDREPSPKRSRRDERVPNYSNLDSGNRIDRDQKPRGRLQDALPLEAPLAPDSKVEIAVVSKESDKKTNKLKEFENETNHSSDPTDVPRSNSYFQHDERGSAEQVGRSFSRRATNERGWRRDSKDMHDERTVNRTWTNDTRQREEKSQAQVRRDDNHVWRHDGFFQMESDPPPPPARKRPAFSEKKISADSENDEKAATEPNHPNRPVLGGQRREERGHNGRHLDRPERPFAGERRPSNRVEAPRGGPTKEGYGGGGSGNYRGGERFSGRQGYHRPGGRVEKWKHDLFHEANRSPTRKNEEDQIAKVEALLSS